MKKAKDYIKKIEEYALLCNINIVYTILPKKEKTYAYWSPSSRTITIDETDLKPYQVIAHFLHELGHFSDDLRTLNKFSDLSFDKINTAYLRFNSNKTMTKNQKRIVLLIETSAWNEGQLIAQKLKIPLGKWYEKAKKANLDIYRYNMGYYEEI